MKVGIIGAGFGGLAAGYYLKKAGVDVTILESDDKPGGLAVGFKKPEWKWSIEKHYHHWFTNDASVLQLADEIGYKVLTVRPKTSTFIGSNIYQLDSPSSLIMFEKLPLKDRIRTGAVLAFLKTTPDWRSLENVTAKEFLIKYGGVNAWKTLWAPLFQKKFDKYADKIPASWFWARIKKRTPSLSYPEGGFLKFALELGRSITNMGGNIYYKSPVEKIIKKEGTIIVKTVRNTYEFDKVIVTLPSPLFANIVQDLPETYKKSLTDLKGIGAVNLLLSLNKQFLRDGTYWLNINNMEYPFLAVVEHTNFMSTKDYGNEHLVYIGNYLPHGHDYFNRDASSLVKEFTPYLKKINPEFERDNIKGAFLFKAYFAQPIVTLGYSSKIPPFATPIKGLYLCNIQQVYPWDRGTNYAVENGVKIAKLVLKSEL